MPARSRRYICLVARAFAARTVATAAAITATAWAAVATIAALTAMASEYDVKAASLEAKLPTNA